MEQAVDAALAAADVVLLSGGTSKGAGDMAFHAVARLSDPGIVVHGVALKPGKPICLAVTGGKPLAILPGFPTSAMFTFHEFVAPVLRAFAGLPPERREISRARLPMKMVSEFGRTTYTLVSLMERPDGELAAYPMGKSSGAVTSFAMADGFFATPAGMELVAAESEVSVTLIGRGAELADLTFIGSHCVGLDLLIGRLEREGLRAKVLSVGSMAGLMAARRGECDIAGIHLMDPATGVYNRPFLDETLSLAKGYVREQGLIFRADDARFAGDAAETVLARLAEDPTLLLANRNAGSGTRILFDKLLKGARPAGYDYQVKSHNAVAAAIAQGRADWGVAIATVARGYGLGFLPLQDEMYDFVIPVSRLSRAPVQRFLALLADTAVRRDLHDLGFHAQIPPNGSELFDG